MEQVAIAAGLGSHRVLKLTPSPFDCFQDDRVQSLPLASSDAGRSLSASSKVNTTALLAPADQAALTRLVAHAEDYKRTASVVTIAANSAQQLPAVLSLLKASGSVFLFSSTPSQARLQALLASKIAISLQRSVTHLFLNEDDDTYQHWTHAQWDIAQSYLHQEVASQTVVSSDEECEKLIFDFCNAIPHQLGPIQLANYYGPQTAEAVAIAFAPSSSIESLASILPANTGLLSLSILSPLSTSRLLTLTPPTVQSVVVLEPSSASSSPLFLDLAAIYNDAEDRPLPTIVSRKLGHITPATQQQAAKALQAAVQPDAPDHGETVGQPLTPSTAAATGAAAAVHIPKHEEAYTKILDTLFGDRLSIANKPNSQSSQSTLPSLAFGKSLAAQEQQQSLQAAVRDALSHGSVADPELKDALAAWLDAPANLSAGERVASLLKSGKSAPSTVSALSSAFARPSTWIIGSDAWSYDLGTSAVHHALSSNTNVNLLVIDSQPYTGPEHAQDLEKRAKKDIGLYAMNYGNAYVASVAVYSDYSQVVRAFSEADSFAGPSVIVAYLPQGENDAARALDILKETKRAVDAGFWPLYRWNPAREVNRVPDEFSPRVGGRGWNASDVNDAFQLDSERIKADLKAFLDRQNHLTQLSRAEPVISQHITTGMGQKITAAVEGRARDAFELLSGAVDGPSLLVLFASDGGNAEKVAKRFSARARARGLGARVQVMDDFSPEDLALEPNVALVTSTAGQGEFPQNGRLFWKALASHTSALGPTGGDGKNFDQMRFSVFGMGDSHYWPRPEDAGYYNKPARDLSKKLEDLGAQTFAPLGLGDDQDPDGYQTAYKTWEAEVWKALGVADVEVKEAEPEPITNEHIKIASNYLRGTIAEGLVDTSTGALAESDGQLTKFHG